VKFLTVDQTQSQTVFDQMEVHVMPISDKFMIALLVGAFVGIGILARLIARQIEKASSKRIAGFTYLLVSMLAFYYLIDLLRSGVALFTDMFFYFWFLLGIVSLFMFWSSWEGAKRQQ